MGGRFPKNMNLAEVYCSPTLHKLLYVTSRTCFAHICGFLDKITTKGHIKHNNDTIHMHTVFPTENKETSQQLCRKPQTVSSYH